MSKFFLLLFLASFTFAINWDYQHTFRLKKDEIATIQVNKEQNKIKNSGLFRFRWTLYKNEGLVVLTNYEGFPYQYVLYRKRGRDLIRQIIDKKPPKAWLLPYMLLKFEDFDEKKEIATIGVFISDPNKNNSVDFIEPKRRK